MASKLSIYDQAARACGAGGVSSLGASTSAVANLDAVYETVVDSFLAKEPWSFAVKKAALSRDSSTPLNEWQYQFSLPGDFLALEALYPRTMNYDLVGQKLYANQTTVEIDYRFRPSESTWPEHFVNAIVAELAKRICIPITEKADRAQLLAREAQQAWVIATNVDAKQRPARSTVDSPFTDVRNI